MKISDIVRTQTIPKHYTTTYPFTVTLHVSGAYPLTVQEESVIQDAIVNAASKINVMRGDAGKQTWGRIVDGKIERLFEEAA